MSNPSKFTLFISKYPQRIRVSLMFFLIILCGFLLWNEFGNQENFKKDVYYEIITGIVFTTLTVFIISLFNWMIGTKEIQEIQRENTLKQMMDLLSGNTPDQKSIINELYSPEATSRLLKTTLSRLNRRLAQGYSLIAACEEDVIRENFNYTVSIYEHAGRQKMQQELSYIRYFKLPPTPDKECYLYCGFAFSTEGLNKLLEQNIYFIREEITDHEMIENLREAITKNDIASAIAQLNLSIRTTLNEIEQTVPAKDIEIHGIVENDIITGIYFRTKVEFTDEDDGMRRYKGRVIFSIPAPEQKRFYCVFADPVIGFTNFRFTVDPKMVENIKDVDFVEILTRAGNGNSHVESVGNYALKFETNDTIFPKSAIITFW